MKEIHLSPVPSWELAAVQTAQAEHTSAYGSVKGEHGLADSRLHCLGGER